MSRLLNDIERCDGVGSDEDGWRVGCETCLRRTAPRPEEFWHMPPPADIDTKCPSLMEPKNVL